MVRFLHARGLSDDRDDHFADAKSSARFNIAFVSDCFVFENSAHGSAFSFLSRVGTLAIVKSAADFSDRSSFQAIGVAMGQPGRLRVE
jgi:hypothetical protein